MALPVVLLVISGCDMQGRFLSVNPGSPAWLTQRLTEPDPQFIPAICLFIKSTSHSYSSAHHPILLLLHQTPYVVPTGISIHSCKSRRKLKRHVRILTPPPPDQSWSCFPDTNEWSLSGRGPPRRPSGSVSAAESKGRARERESTGVFAGEWWHVKVKEESHSFVPPHLNSFICSRNKQMRLITPPPHTPPHLPDTSESSLQLASSQQQNSGMKCFTHIYTVPPFFFLPVLPFFLQIDLCGFLCGLRYTERAWRLHGEHLVTTRPHSCHWNLESIQQRIPLVLAAVVEQSVLIGCTPVSPPPPPPPDANPSGSVVQKWALAAYVFFWRVQCVLCSGAASAGGKLMVFSLNFIVLASRARVTVSMIGTSVIHHNVGFLSVNHN